VVFHSSSEFKNRHAHGNPDDSFPGIGIITALFSITALLMHNAPPVVRLSRLDADMSKHCAMFANIRALHTCCIMM